MKAWGGGEEEGQAGQGRRPGQRPREGNGQASPGLLPSAWLPAPPSLLTRLWKPHSHHLAFAYAGPCLHAVPLFFSPSGSEVSGWDLKTVLWLPSHVPFLWQCPALQRGWESGLCRSALLHSPETPVTLQDIRASDPSTAPCRGWQHTGERSRPGRELWLWHCSARLHLLASHGFLS